ncbi:alpha/beta hydrolase [Massilia sp. MS-15]|nr:alpha/beta hydrolase [Massilia sp. MS-15]
MQCEGLIQAGLWYSGPDHWQSQWQRRRPSWARPGHRDWNTESSHGPWPEGGAMLQAFCRQIGHAP